MNRNIGSKYLDSMNFLNEVIEQYPDAISFASGRPNTRYLPLAPLIADFNNVLSRDNHYPLNIGPDTLEQYGQTSGQFNEHIVKYLATDECFNVNLDDVIVTNGAQEALAISIDTLLNRDEVLLVFDPTYIGVVGVCKIRGIEVHAIDLELYDSIPDALEDNLSLLADQGKKARALYIVPDFSNPLGATLTHDERLQLLSWCTENDVYILEDCAYRYFNYDKTSPPTLAQLDSYGIVLHIGSFSKTICPGLRIGYIICSSNHGHSPDLVRNLNCVKSFTTLNTPTVTQAIVANTLCQHDYSVRSMVEPARAAYQETRDQMLLALAKHFTNQSWTNRNVNWSTPLGGFFLTLNVPFDFTLDDAANCASEFGVICVPMSLFSLNDNYLTSIRLAFSYVQLTDIDQGCLRLSNYCKYRLQDQL